MRDLEGRLKLASFLPNYDSQELSNDVEFMKKALVCIEYMSLYADLQEDKGDSINSIYRMSHVALGRCYAIHDEWVKEVNDLYDNLVERGYV